MPYYKASDGVPIELINVMARHNVSFRKLGAESGRGTKVIFNLAHGQRHADDLPDVRRFIENALREKFGVPDEEIGIIWRKVGALDGAVSPIEYFDLRYEPFALLPDPNFFLETKQFKKAGTYFCNAIHSRGIWVMVGPYGIGKTTFLKRQLQKLVNDRRIRPALLSTDLTGQSPQNIKRMLYHRWLGRAAFAEFGSERSFWNCSVACLQTKIEEYIGRVNAQGSIPVIIIDDAQQLRAQQLEMLRGMLNSQWSDATKLSIILVGQDELWGHISGTIPLRGSVSLAALRDRIRTPFEFACLTEREVIPYIDYRVKTAGGDWKKIFEKAALEYMIEALDQILPRQVNWWCSEAMLYFVRMTEDGSAKGPRPAKVTPQLMQWVRQRAIEAGKLSS